MRALIIDDSKLTRTIESRILKGIGFEVIEARDGKDGLEQLETAGPFDLAIVDWYMPELDGLGFIQAARENSLNSALKILVLTIESNISTMAKALEAGADDYAVKPISEKLLREKLTGINLTLP